MTSNLVSDLTLQSLDQAHIRKTISEKITRLQHEFASLPQELASFNKELAMKYKKKWKEDSLKKKVQRENISIKLQRLKDLSRDYRLQVINELSENWYDRLWDLRAEISLITAFYDFSALEESPLFMYNWKKSINRDFAPVTLRLNGPRKPTKKNARVSDVKYDVKAAIIKMLKPLEEWAIDTEKAVIKLKKARKEQSMATKRKRFREAFVAREYITVLCQAVAPRQSNTNNENDKE